MRRSFVTGAGIILVLAQIGWADLPATISYQGVLKDNNGQIVADGPYSLTFAITDTLGNKQGTPTPWSETHNVTTAEGIFEVILGSITPFANYAIRFNYPYWLEITVDGSVLSPRTKLNAVPYAFRAEGIRSDVTAFHPGWGGSLGIGTSAPQHGLELTRAQSGDYIATIENTAGDFTGGEGLMVGVADVTSSGVSALLVKGAADTLLAVSNQGDVQVAGNLDVQGTITQSAHTEYYSFGVRDATSGVSGTSLNYAEAWYDTMMSMGYPLSIAIPVHLPHGATITGISIQVDDNANAADTRCQLYSMATSDYTLTENSLTPQDDFWATGTGQLLVSSDILSYVVDNQAKRYWLRITTGEPTITGATIKFYGGYITYTVN